MKGARPELGGLGFFIGGEERIEYPPARAFHSYPTGSQCSRRMEESNRDIELQPRNPFQSSTRYFLRQVNWSAGHKKVTRGVFLRSTHQNFKNGGMNCPIFLGKRLGMGSDRRRRGAI